MSGVKNALVFIEMDTGGVRIFETGDDGGALLKYATDEMLRFSNGLTDEQASQIWAAISNQSAGKH